MPRFCLALLPLLGVGVALAPRLAHAAPPTALSLDSRADDGPFAPPPDGVDNGTPSENTIAVGRAARRRARRNREPAEPSRPRKGFFIAAASAPGTSFYSDGILPLVRTSIEIGGGVNDSITLGANLHLSTTFDRKYVALGGDVTMTGYVHKGFFLRAGLGAVSRQPIATFVDEVYAPGVGGTAGLGYEFALGKWGGLALGLEYDGRYLINGIGRHTALLGLRFNVYPPTKDER